MKYFMAQNTQYVFLVSTYYLNPQRLPSIRYNFQNPSYFRSSRRKYCRSRIKNRNSDNSIRAVEWNYKFNGPLMKDIKVRDSLFSLHIHSCHFAMRHNYKGGIKDKEKRRKLLFQPCQASCWVNHIFVFNVFMDFIRLSSVIRFLL